MNEPFLFPLDACRDTVLAGGKAVGLGKLIRLGFRVPHGLCLTTAAYGYALQKAGVDPQREWEALRAASDQRRLSLLDAIRHRITSSPFPEQIRNELERHLDGVGLDSGTLWAVRSSCSEEDEEEASFGGMYRTVLGVPRSELLGAISQCWASLWSLPAWLYRRDAALGRADASPPQMAVVLQPMLAARAAGVMYSQHPLTKDPGQVVIDAVVGLAEPLVSGQVVPDHFVVSVDQGRPKVVERQVVAKARSREVSPTGLVDRLLPESAPLLPAVSDEELLALADEAKRVERGLGYAVDIEWLLDERGRWLLQARPIARLQPRGMLTAERCVWSRANFQETLPDVPSPLAVAWLQEYMETNILAHYRDAGCQIPAGLSSVRIVRGRPYINVTLTQAVTTQLGADASEVIELMGGAATDPPPGVQRMTGWPMMRATVNLGWKVLRAPKLAPAWFSRLKSLATGQDDATLGRLSEADLLDRLFTANETVRAGDLTFALVAAVSQALRALRLILQRRVEGTGWRPLLNAATQGFGTVISARQIGWLVELAEVARQDPVARAFLLAEPWVPHLDRDRLAGTPFLGALDEFLEEYGHRAIGESDIRSPRFNEEPGYLLGVIRGHLLASQPRSVSAVQEQQAQGRAVALREIRKVFGWRIVEWWWFSRWHGYLCRVQALREANRHYLMHYVAGMKRLLLHLGKRLVQRGLFDSADDIFFLIPDEIRKLVAELPKTPSCDWKRVVAQRRVRMEQDQAFKPPDVLTGDTGHRIREGDGETPAGSGLKGMPISAGYAEGRVRLLHTPQDYSLVESGDILVAPVLDPGMAPLLGLAGGVIVEMGGMLSHGAIIAREYGIPALANVARAMAVLREGERVVLDAELGEVRRVEPP